MLARVSLALCGLAACVVDPEPDESTLPSDAYFTGIPVPFATPEACFAANPSKPYVCEYELALCQNGRAGLRGGDLLSQGTYHLADHSAVGDLDGTAFQFDLVTDTGVLFGQQWVPDMQGRWQTPQWDSIDCSRPY